MLFAAGSALKSSSNTAIPQNTSVNSLPYITDSKDANPMSSSNENKFRIKASSSSNSHSPATINNSVQQLQAAKSPLSKSLMSSVSPSPLVSNSPVQDSQAAQDENCQNVTEKAQQSRVAICL